MKAKHLVSLLVLAFIMALPVLAGAGNTYEIKSIGVNVDALLRTVPIGSYTDATVQDPSKLEKLGLTGLKKGDRVRVYNVNDTGYWRVKNMETGEEIETSLGFDEPDRGRDVDYFGDRRGFGGGFHRR